MVSNTTVGHPVLGEVEKLLVTQTKDPLKSGFEYCLGVSYVNPRLGPLNSGQPCKRTLEKTREEAENFINSFDKPKILYNEAFFEEVRIFLYNTHCKDHQKRVMVNFSAWKTEISIASAMKKTDEVLQFLENIPTLRNIPLSIPNGVHCQRPTTPQTVSRELNHANESTILYGLSNLRDSPGQESQISFTSESEASTAITTPDTPTPAPCTIDTNPEEDPEVESLLDELDQHWETPEAFVGAYRVEQIVHKQLLKQKAENVECGSKTGNKKHREWFKCGIADAINLIEAWTRFVTFPAYFNGRLSEQGRDMMDRLCNINPDHLVNLMRASLVEETFTERKLAEEALVDEPANTREEVTMRDESETDDCITAIVGQSSIQAPAEQKEPHDEVISMEKDGEPIGEATLEADHKPGLGVRAKDSAKSHFQKLASVVKPRHSHNVFDGHSGSGPSHESLHDPDKDESKEEKREETLLEEGKHEGGKREEALLEEGKNEEALLEEAKLKEAKFEEVFAYLVSQYFAEELKQDGNVIIQPVPVNSTSSWRSKPKAWYQKLCKRSPASNSPLAGHMPHYGPESITRSGYRYLESTARNDKSPLVKEFSK
ncbi:uncharacterized protein BCR38DRAFT_407704 [Pseudomassariella vexata]|uniref:Bacteriophage T5 Orf172 DNA-binding domain-containing protein n=1 Tax=Pseudomassariella vexata TaxID=1141098 RepID=A0A1Y2E909_9PEZI|nr:uncharacterized protein BCR38DRAFT_407704 [Pseudomassariella vexata]ORY67766.1 hypothetical protein BCR38DRAFT_407704 [Pseudomassariella vexata]